MLLALTAILSHKSAHSFTTGPVMAEPFITPLLLTLTPALSSKNKEMPHLFFDMIFIVKLLLLDGSFVLVLVCLSLL